MADTVIFHSIAVNAIERNAAIFVGENVANDWSSHGKTQGGIVLVIGYNNIFPSNINIINDNDIVDTSINDTDYNGLNSTTQS